jgi:hypothetical protein
MHPSLWIIREICTCCGLNVKKSMPPAGYGIAMENLVKA